jgi:hypothetical protein
VYRCGIHLVIGNAAATSVCQKSLDGGRTWIQTLQPVFPPDMEGGSLSPRTGPCNPGIGHAVTDTRGTLYVPKAHCGQPWLAISQDEGDTWKRVQVSDLGVSTYEHPSVPSACPPMCEALGYTEKHDAAVGVDRDGTIYYAWIAKDRQGYLSVSLDHAATWSTPVRVTQTEILETVFLELAVGAPGRIAMAVVASENSTGPPWTQDRVDTTWNGYLTASLDARSLQPTFYSATINEPGDPLVRGDCWFRCGPMADYIDVRIAPDGTPWAPFVDGCLDACPVGGLPFAHSLAIAGHLIGIDLWDEEDPNGPYP